MIRPLRFVAAGLLVAGFAAVSCNTYNSSLLEGSSGNGGGANLPNAFGYGWWSKKTAEGCDDVGFPTADQRPAKSAAGTDVDPIYLGMTKMYIGETTPPTLLPALPDNSVADQPYHWVGLDIDGICTNPIGCDAAPQDVIPCITGTGVAKPADGVGCRDNMFVSLEPVAAQNPTLGKPFGINEGDINCEIYRGGFNLIFKVTGYNGQANDDSVRVDEYNSPGLEDAFPAWDCVKNANNWQDQPAWLASNRWYVSADELDTNTKPVANQWQPARVNYDPSAYVKNGVLVAHLNAGTIIRFIGDRATQRPAPTGGDQVYPQEYLPGGFKIVLNLATVVGHLYKKGGVWVLEDAVLAGAIRKDDMLGAFEELGYCEQYMADKTQYGILTNYLQNSNDVISTGVAAPDQACDAMSVGLGFQATAISPGDPYGVSVLNRCLAPTPGTGAQTQ